jgi:hypothetical protein
MNEIIPCSVKGCSKPAIVKIINTNEYRCKACLEFDLDNE